MASHIPESVIDGAGSHFRHAGSVAGLADSRVRKAESGHRGKSNKHPTKFRVATWKVGTLKKRGTEVVETLTRRRVDLCRIQEHRWAGSLATNQTRLLKGKDSTYKFFWSGNARGQGGAGILLAEKWINKVFDVLRISDRIIMMRLVIGKRVFTFVSVYAPQSGLPEAVTNYDQLQSITTRIPVSEVLIPVGDWNGLIGSDSAGFEDVHRGRGFGVRNAEGERVLGFGLANDLLVGNSCFIKRESHLVTYCSGRHRTQLDLILYRKSFSKAVNDVKVIPVEECAQLHNLVVCDLTVFIPPAKRHKFTPRIRTWKLRDPNVAERFHATFVDKISAADFIKPAGAVEGAWSRIKTPLLEAATEVCGLSRDHQWKRKTWWWDDKVDEGVKKKRACFRAFKAQTKAGKMEEAKKAKDA